MLVIIIFTSRAIKDFLGVFDLGVIPIVDPCVGSIDAKIYSSQTAPIKDQALLFIVSFVWDIVPASLVCLLFWHIPKPREGGERRGAGGGGKGGGGEGFIAMANPTLVHPFSPIANITR